MTVKKAPAKGSPSDDSKKATVSKTNAKTAATGTTPRVRARATKAPAEPRPSAPLGFVSFVFSCAFAQASGLERDEAKRAEEAVRPT